MAKVLGRALMVSRVRLDRQVLHGFVVATIVAMMPLLGCGGSSGTTGSGGAPPASGGRSGAGSGGASGSGGQAGSIAGGGANGSAGALGRASGGIQGGGGTAAGGAAGGAMPAGTGGSGSGAAGGSSASGGAAGGGGKSGSGGAAGGGRNGGAGSSAGGRNGAGGIAAGGRNGSGSGGAGANGGSGGGGGGTASTSALLVDLGNAFCAAARSCCMKKGLPTTLSDCEAKFSSRLYGLAYYDKGTETIDNAALATCIAAYKDTATTCAFRPLELACRGVFVGTKSEGAPCGKGGLNNMGGSGECKATGRATTCLWTGDSNLSTTTGVCLTPAHGKKGDPCASDCRKNDTCVFDLFTSPGSPTATCFEEDGLYCQAQENDTYVCAAIVPTGGNCQDLSFSACASTDYCDGTGSSYKCRTGSTLGQACSSSGPNCVWGMSLVCGASQQCEDLGFAYDATCSGAPPFP